MLCGLRVRHFRKVARETLARGGAAFVVTGIPVASSVATTTDNQQCPMGFGGAQEKQPLCAVGV
jgi:hypothetical protein